MEQGASQTHRQVTSLLLDEATGGEAAAGGGVVVGQEVHEAFGAVPWAVTRMGSATRSVV
ncbi:MULTISPECIES: hypothetical protein [unclassified Streptomyces]|uniref:hypothetical protein n=1 Tax=unclassified Streptomyces TaxID=2593676 RepID=UPI00344D9A2E